MAIHTPPSSTPPKNHGYFKHVDDGCYLDVPLLQDQGDARQQAKHTVTDDDSPQGTTFIRTCLNGLNALSGVGIISIPYALSEGGWLSLLFLLTVAIICYYTGLLLQRCMSAATQIRSYPDIGDFAFGYKGRIAISFFMYSELYLVAIEFLILEGDNLDNLFPNTSLEFGIIKIKGKQLFTILSALVFLPTTWLQNLGIFAYVSAGGVLASIIVVVSVLFVGVFDNVGFQSSGNIFNLSGLSTALGLYSFCYCGHAVFPTICTSMRNKSQFPRVLFVCFILCTLNYGLMAIFGYLMYGDDVKSQITLNLPKGSVGAHIAIYTTLINPFTKYALMVIPMASAIEERFLITNKHITLVTRTLLVASTVAVALSIPLFGYLMALIGSFLSVVVSILLPCLCYLKIFGISQQTKSEIVIISGILIAGATLAVVGTYSSLKQIVHNL